ncbi:MAG: hypothetical protein ACOYJS_07780 [Acutalibacteraceae bacterium]
MNKKSIKKIVVIFVICLTLCVSLFVVQYKQMPNKAKGELGTYLAKNLPEYISMQNIYYKVDLNTNGYKVTLGGNVKNRRKSSVTLFAEIQFNHLMLNPKIKTTKINNRKFDTEKAKEYKNWNNYWWN